MALLVAFLVILAADHAGPCSYSGEPYLKEDRATGTLVLDGAAIRVTCPIH